VPSWTSSFASSPLLIPPLLFFLSDLGLHASFLIHIYSHSSPRFGRRRKVDIKRSEARKKFKGPKFFGRPSAAAAAEGPEIWTFAL